MQLLKLQPGQALYFSPGNLHAYLSGDWLECMACSDNTVRGGLTPKFVDRENLLAICDYQGRGEPYLQPDGDDANLRLFAPKGLQEFVLEELKSGFEEPAHAVDSAVELIFCLDGATRLSARGIVSDLSSGEAVLIPAALSAYSLRVVSGQAFRVGCPVGRGL